MKITLRKAHRLVKSLEEELRFIAIRKSVHHSATDKEVKNTLLSVQNDNKENILKRLEVVSAISEIREALQIANSRIVDGESVDTLLNRKVKIERTMRVLAAFAIVEKTSDDERLDDYIRAVQDAHTDSSGYRDNRIQIDGYSTDTHNEFNKQYNQLKRDQETVSDKLAYMNNKLEIEVDDKFNELFEVLQVL